MKKDRGLLLASRIIGGIVAGLLCLIMIPHILEGITREEPYLPIDRPWEGVIMTVAPILFVTGYGVSWKNQGIGGLIMVIAGLSISIPFIFIQGNVGALMFGLPFIVVGLLFVIYWNDVRKFNRMSNA